MMSLESIQKFKISKHANQRITERYIPRPAINAVLMHGKKTAGRDRIVIYRAFGLCVLVDGKTIVTVYDEV